jgi:tight adherence protein C
MIILVSFLGFISIFIAINILLKLLLKGRLQLASRLHTIKGETNAKENINELDTPFFDRVIRPIGDRLSMIISKTTPGGLKERIHSKLIMAGNPLNISVSRWILIKISFMLFFTSISWGSAMATDSLTPKRIALLFILTFILYSFPNLILINLIQKRKKKIVNTLPDVLDLLTVSVEAGLSFDGALSRVVNNMEGDLSKEFSRVLNEMKMGKNRRDALRDMGQRCGVTDLTSLIGAIIQADELGVGITNVLRIQSKQMRVKRHQRAQEKAMKAPIKMLFPLILFIFPTIFTVLLGPAIIRIMEVLFK